MKPILFSTEMIRSILSSEKTMTRRVVKPQPVYNERFYGGWGICTKKSDTAIKLFNDGCYKDLCPYGQIGDRLWCKESLRKKPDYTWCKEGYAIYVADNEQVLIGGAGIGEGVPWEWKMDILPSIFMPRWASRITLEITNIRVERLQEITESGCIAEGVRYPVTQERHPLLDISSKYCAGNYLIDKFKDGKYVGNNEDWIKAHFASLWDEINYKRGYGWATNPWVWVNLRK